MMTLDEFKSHLLASHEPQQLAAIPLTFAFCVTRTATPTGSSRNAVTPDHADARIAFTSEAGVLTLLADDAATDVDIYLGTIDNAMALFNGTTPPMEAFSAGHLRSNGYLMWVFRIVFAFMKAAAPKS